MIYHEKEYFISLYDNDNDTLLGTFDDFEEMCWYLELDWSKKAVRNKFIKHLYDTKKKVETSDCIKFRVLQPYELDEEKKYWYIYLFEDTPNDELADLIM